MLFTIIVVLFLIIGGVVLTNILYKRYREYSLRKHYEKMYGGAAIVKYIADKMPILKDLEKAIGINLADLNNVMNGEMDGLIKLLQGLIKFAPPETQESLNRILNPIFSNIKDVQILVKDDAFMNQFFKTFQLSGGVKDAVVLVLSLLGYDAGYFSIGTACLKLSAKNVMVTSDVLKYVMDLAHYLPTEKFAKSLKELIDRAIATNISPRLKKLLGEVKKRIRELDIFIGIGKLINSNDYAGALQKVWELMGDKSSEEEKKLEGAFNY
jgi:hypothetical protein